MKRIFIAIKVNLDPEFISAIDHLKEELDSERIKWVEDENLHLTLRFLGDTDERMISEIRESLDQVLKRHHSFSFFLSGMGYFASHGNIKAFFINLQESIELKQLKASIDEGLREIGIEQEERDFKPHLTLARVKYLEKTTLFKELIDKYVSLKQKIVVEKIILYESRLYPQGPVYTPLCQFILR